MINMWVDASPDAACIVDRDLRLLHVNANYVRLSGLKHRELRKDHMQGLCHSHFHLESCEDEGGCVARRVFATGRPCRVDEVYSRTQSLRLIVLAVPLFDENGEVYAVIEQLRDVTAESRMQSNYKQLLDLQRRQNELLQEEVKRQTRALQATNQELQVALQRVEQLAKTDALTSLFNRRHFDEIFAREMETANRLTRELSLVIFDLDHFKRINDELGHMAGDTVLKRFADTLMQCARASDVIARVGGEEFIALLPATGTEGALAFFNRVSRALEEAGFPTTASAGTASVPHDAASQADLFAIADKALYAAKASGRARAVTAAQVART